MIVSESCADITTLLHDGWLGTRYSEPPNRRPLGARGHRTGCLVASTPPTLKRSSLCLVRHIAERKRQHDPRPTVEEHFQPDEQSNHPESIAILQISKDDDAREHRDRAVQQRPTPLRIAQLERGDNSKSS